MNDIKLIRLIKTFNKGEFRKFTEFVHSPYFNKNNNVVSLFNAIAGYYPLFNNKNFTKEYLYGKAFPGESFRNSKFKNNISDIFSLAEKFLGYKVFEKKPYSSREFTHEFSVLYELRERGLNSLYESMYLQTLEKINNMKFKNENYYFAKHELYGDFLWYLPFAKPNPGINILQESHDNFVHYAVIRLLKFYSLMLHEKNTINIEYNYSLMNELTEYIAKSPVTLNPAIQIYKATLLLMRNNSVGNYTQLKKTKDKYFEGLNEWDQRRVLIHMYDYCAYMVNSRGDDSYNRDMFEIYVENLNRKFMTLKNFLYPDFMNIVKIACRVGEFSFAEKFINEYKSSIKAEDKLNVLEFCAGIIAFSKKNYSTAMIHLSRSNFQIFIFKVQVKILLLQTYYKLNMFEEAFGMIDTFRHFTAREDNIKPEHKESYLQFLQLLTELIKVRGATGVESELILSKIKRKAGKIPANPFRIKIWLIEEIEQLLN